MSEKPGLSPINEVSAISFIQEKLVVNKNQINSFGNYKYRSCEDILNAVKPLLKEINCNLIINDEIIMIGDRFYVKATATLTDKNGKTVQTVAYAREPAQKKGMDESQITGATSSYARKYALNGLFAIDDVKDADTMDNSIEKPVAKKYETPKESSKPKVDDKKLVEALVKLNSIFTVAELQQLWNDYKDLQGLNDFKKAVTDKKIELTKN